MLPSPAPSSGSSSLGSGGTLVALDGRPLPLRRADLRVRARGGLARTVLEQTFVNPHAEPLRVTYTLPLPADGAVSGFRFRIDDLEVVGEVDRRARARERFEEALITGRTAALVEQERSSVFTQEVGNIPPGATVVATIEVDQPLAWRTDAGQGSGGWEYRFPTVVAPRYLGAEGRVADAARIEVAVADRRRPIAMSLRLHIDELLAAGGLPASPSHALTVVREAVAAPGDRSSSAGTADWTVGLADEGAGLDRDVVVRWPVATPEVGLSIDAARPAEGRATAEDAFGLLTLVPPRRRPDPVPRDLIVLLDTSGSMHGEPLAQAQRIACALVSSLGEQDQLELIEFSTAPRRFKRKARPATARNREKAIAWIRKLSAGGGTEMRTGILAALEGLRTEAQRQIVLVTDGHIGFEDEVLAEIAQRLPAGSRVHTVGVGSSVNRSLTQAAARAGRGLELVVGIGEDPEPAAARLLTRTEAPLVVDLELSGDALREHAPQRLPDLFAGSPALVAARLRPEGGVLQVRGRTALGTWHAQVQVPARAPGEGSPGIVARFGREKVEDLELRHAVGGDGKAIDREIEALGVRFQIATRLTSWIAVSKEATVDPGAPTRHEDVPQELPYGMSVEGLGLRVAGGPSGAIPTMPVQAYAAAPMPGAPASLGAIMGPPPSPARNVRSRSSVAMPPPPPSAAPRPAAPARPAAPRPAAPAQAAKGEAAPPREQAVAKERAADASRAEAKASEVAAPKKKQAYREEAPARDIAEEATRSPRDAASDGWAQPEAPFDASEDAEIDRAATTGAFPRLDLADAPADRAASTGAFPQLADDLEEGEAEIAAPAPAAPMPSLGTLPARVVLHRDGTLVLEVDVRFALAWRPPATLVAVTADGESALVTLRVAGTTAAAALEAGMRLRLVIELPDGMPVPERLELDLDGRLLTLAPIGQPSRQASR